MDRREERGNSTRQHVLSVATRLFAQSGFGPVSIETVLIEARISRGALYHHFASKEALFTAVLESEEARIAATVTAVARDARTPLAALRAGCSAWLELAATDVAIQRIVLTDAAAVVGRERWREIDRKHGFGLLVDGFNRCAAAGLVSWERSELYAHVMLATLTELALLVAQAPSVAPVLAMSQETIERLLCSLIQPESSDPLPKRASSLTT